MIYLIISNIVLFFIQEKSLKYKIHNECPKEINPILTSISPWQFYGCNYPNSKVKIGENVQKISPYSFYKAIISELTFNSNVISIEQGAFAKCCIKLNFNDMTNLKTIGDCSFYMSKLIPMIIFPKSLEIIGSYAFANITTITNATINAKIIKQNSFYGCYNMYCELIEIYGSGKIEKYAFYDCYQLNGTLKIHEPIEKDQQNNFIYSKIGISSFENSGISRLQLPYIDTIEKRCFCNCSHLTFCSILNVKSIGISAFEGDYQFEIQSLISNNISNSAFHNCSKIKQINQIDDGVIRNQNEIIGNCGENIQYEYHEDTSTLYIKNQVPGYQKNYMYNFTQNNVPWKIYSPKIKEIYVSQNIKSIGSYSFFNCASLTQVFFQDVEYISDFAFYGCVSLNSLNSNFYYLDSLGDSCFEKCEKLSIKYVNKLVSIGKRCFFGCNNLTSVIFSNAININEEAFSSCINLKSIIISNYSKIISRKTFYNCSNLISFTLPQELTYIGDEAFGECKKLSIINFNKNLESIGEMAFIECISLKIVDLPICLKGIGNYAFCNCYNLTSIIINKNVQFIGIGTFYNCQNISIIYFLGKKEPNIDKEWLLNNKNLNEIIVPFNYKQNTFGGLNVSFLIDQNSYKLSGYSCYNFFIPKTGSLIIYGYGDIIFYLDKNYCLTVKQLIIRKGITSIPYLYCENYIYLQSIYLDETVKSIGNGAFKNCTDLKSIDLTYINNLENNIFTGSSLNKIIFNEIDPPMCSENTFSFEELQSIKAYVTHIYNSDEFCGLSIVYNDEPIQNVTASPEANTSIIHTNPFDIRRDQILLIINMPQNIDEQTFNKTIMKYLNLYSNNTFSNIIIELNNVKNFSFNVNLKPNQFLKLTKDCTIYYYKGMLNLILSKSRINVISSGNYHIETNIKGSGQLNFSDIKNNTFYLYGNFQINGSLKLIFPNHFNYNEINSINFQSFSSVKVRKLNDRELYLYVNDIVIDFNSKVNLNLLRITNSLTIFQTSKIYHELISYYGANIYYQIFNYENKNNEGCINPFYDSTFNDAPNSIILHKITDNPNAKPVINADYTLLSGFFPSNNCEEWISKINYGNSEFSSIRCENINENNSLFKKIIVKALPKTYTKQKTMLVENDIKGIAIGCTSITLFIAIIIFLIVRYKKKKELKSNDENSA